MAENINVNANPLNRLRVPRSYHRKVISSENEPTMPVDEYDLSSYFPGGTRIDRVIVLGAKVAPKYNYPPWFFLAPRETNRSHSAAFSLMCRVLSTILNFVFSCRVCINHGLGYGKVAGDFNYDYVRFESDDVIPVYFIDNFDDSSKIDAYNYFNPSAVNYWRKYSATKNIRSWGEHRTFIGPQGLVISCEPNDWCRFSYSFAGLKFYSNTRITLSHYYKQNPYADDPSFDHLFYSKHYREYTLVLSYDPRFSVDDLVNNGFDAWVALQDRKPMDDMIGWTDDECKHIARCFDGIHRTFKIDYKLRWCTDRFGNEFIKAEGSGSCTAVLRLILSCIPSGMDINKFMHYIHGNIYTDLLHARDMAKLDSCRGEADQIVVQGNEDTIASIQRTYPNVDLNQVPSLTYLAQHLEDFFDENCLACYNAFKQTNRNQIIATLYPAGIENVPEEQIEADIVSQFGHHYVDVLPRNHRLIWRPLHGFNYRHNQLYQRVAGFVNLVRPRRRNLNEGRHPVRAAHDANDGEPIVRGDAPERIRENDAAYRIDETRAVEILRTEDQPVGNGNQLTIGEVRMLYDFERARGEFYGNQAGSMVMLSNILDKYKDGTLDDMYFSSAYLCAAPDVRKEIDKLVESLSKKYDAECKKQAAKLVEHQNVSFGKITKSNYGDDDDVFDNNVLHNVDNFDVVITDQGVSTVDNPLIFEFRPVLYRNTPTPDENGIRKHSVRVEKFTYMKPWYLPNFLISFLCLLFNCSSKLFFKKVKTDTRMLHINERWYYNSYISCSKMTKTGAELYDDIRRNVEGNAKFYLVDPETPSMEQDTLLMTLLMVGMYDSFLEEVLPVQTGQNTVLMDMALKTPYFQQPSHLHLVHITPIHLSLSLILILFLVPFLYLPPLSICVYQLPQLLYQKIMSVDFDTVLLAVIQNQVTYLLALYVILLLGSVISILFLSNHLIFCHLMLGSTQLITILIVSNSLKEFTWTISILSLSLLTVINSIVYRLLLKMNPIQLTKCHVPSILVVILVNVSLVLCLSLLKIISLNYLNSLSISQSKNVLTMLKNLSQIQDLSFAKLISALLKHILKSGLWIQSNLLSTVTYLVILLITVVLIYQMMPSLKHVSHQLKVPITSLLVILVIISGANACQEKCLPRCQMDCQISSLCPISSQDWEAMNLNVSVKEMMGCFPSSYQKELEQNSLMMNTLKCSPLMLNSVSENRLKQVLSVDSTIRYLPMPSSKTSSPAFQNSYGITLTLIQTLKDVTTSSSQNFYPVSQRLQAVQLLQKSVSMDSLSYTTKYMEIHSALMENYEEGISIMMNSINNYLNQLKIALMIKYMRKGEYMILNLEDSVSGITLQSRMLDMNFQKLNDVNITKCLTLVQQNRSSLKITSPSFVPMIDMLMNSFIPETIVYNPLQNATFLEFPLLLVHHTGVRLNDYYIMLQQHTKLNTARNVFNLIDQVGDDFDKLVLFAQDCNATDIDNITNSTIAQCFYNKTRIYLTEKGQHLNPLSAFVIQVTYVYSFVNKQLDKYSYWAMFDPRIYILVFTKAIPSFGKLLGSLNLDVKDATEHFNKVGELSLSGTPAELNSYLNQVGLTQFAVDYATNYIFDFVSSGFYFGYFENDYANKILSYHYKSNGMFFSVEYKLSWNYKSIFAIDHLFVHTVSKLLYLPDSFSEYLHKLVSYKDKFVDELIF